MEFNVNSLILFGLVGIIVLLVLAQSVFFLVRAWRRAKKIGIESSKLKRIARTAAIFTIAPAIAIVVSVIILAKDLGLPLPWLRLSVVGSMSYEAIAAANAEHAMGLTQGAVAGLTAQQYVTITCVMTLSILVGIWLVPLIAEKIQKGMITAGNKDKKWSDLLSAAMFIGMISAFIGYVFCDFSTVFKGDWSGLIPVLVFLVSALIMVISGIVVKKTKWRWVSDYALPFSLICGMLSAIPFTAWLK